MPIVALTVNVFTEAKELFSEAGMDGFIAKPIETGKLAEVLARFLHGKGA